jgi:hypothetical protein
MKFENIVDDSDEACFPQWYEIMKLLEEKEKGSEKNGKKRMEKNI